MSARNTRRRRSSVIAVAKDLACFGLGAWLIIRQGSAPKEEFNLALLLFGGILMNVAAADQLRLLLTASPRSPEGPEELPSSLGSSLSDSTTED